MTRINTIDPQDLTDQWLIAEWRELPRIPNTIITGKAKVDLKKIPLDYRLGQGHCLFFYNKLLYLQKRHSLICAEMDCRGMKRDPAICVDLSRLSSVYKSALCSNWTPTQRDHYLNIDRLCERFSLRKRAYTLKGDKINCNQSFTNYFEKCLKKYLKDC